MRQNKSHYTGQPLLEIISNVISESLYFVVGSKICPISALYFDVTWLAKIFPLRLFLYFLSQ